MKSIDNLFSGKLNSENNLQLCKNNPNSSADAHKKSIFNKKNIKSKIVYVIKKEDNCR